MRNVSAAARRALFGQESGEVFVPTIVIEYDVNGTLNYMRFVGDTIDLTLGGELYTAIPFYFEMPADEKGRIQEVRLGISNVHRDIVDAIREMPTPPNMELKIVRRDTTPEVVAGPYDMILEQVSYNATVIEGTLTRRQRLDINFPKAAYAYTPVQFPGAF